MYSTSFVHVSDDEGQKRDMMEVMPKKAKVIFFKSSKSRCAGDGVEAFSTSLMHAS